MPSNQKPTASELLAAIPPDLDLIRARFERISGIKDGEIRVSRLQCLRADMVDLDPKQPGIADLVGDVENAIAVERVATPLENSKGLVALIGPSVAHGMGSEGAE